MSPQEDAGRVGDLLSAPLEELLIALGSGIGQSQAELDRHSIEIQRLIDEDATLAQYGLEATWYQIPRTEVEVKVAVAMERQTRSTAGELPDAGPPRARLWVQPVNATVSNLLSFDVQAASTVRLNVVAVPPPGHVGGATPVHTREDAIAAAKLADNPNLRTSANFNPGALAWFVRQTDEAKTPPTLFTLVRVDDETLSAVDRVRDGKAIG
jgi:hypothetical protein